MRRRNKTPFILVNQWDRGYPALIRIDQITAITDLPPYQCETTLTDGGRRTRIDTANGPVLASEPFEEIAKILGDSIAILNK